MITEFLLFLNRKLAGTKILTLIYAICCFQSTSAGTPNDLVCVSKGCIEVASLLANSMNTSHDPCQEFYLYACENWDRFRIDGGTSKYPGEYVFNQQLRLTRDMIEDSKSWSSTAFSKFHKYIDLCKEISEKGAKGQIESGMKYILNEIPPTPLLSDKFDESTFDLTDFVILLHELQKPFYVEVTITEDNGVHLPAVAFTVPNHEIPDFGNLDKVAQEALNDMISLLNISTQNSASALMGIRNNFAAIKSTSNAQTADRMPKENISSFLPTFDIEKFLNYMDPQHNYRFEDGILVFNQSEFSQAISGQNHSELANSLAFEIYWAAKELLIKNIDINDPVKTSQTCDERSLEVFQSLYEYMYAKTFMDELDLEVAQGMEKNIGSSLEEVVNKAWWFDQTSKSVALEKVKQLYLKIGHDPNRLNLGKLDQDYEKLKFDSAEDFPSVLIDLHAFLEKREFQKRRMNFTRDYLMNAVVHRQQGFEYKLKLNSLVIPDGALQAPYFRGYYPEQFTYGSVGFQVAKQLMNGFGANGKNFSKSMKEKNWWTNETEANYRDLLACFNNISANLANEMVSDQGAMAIAFKAFERYKNSNGMIYPLPGLDLTVDQAFFVSSVQPFCEISETLELNAPEEKKNAQERLQALVNHYQEFSKAFQCNSNVPDDQKCRAW